MIIKRKPLTIEKVDEWARAAHSFYLSALMQESSLTCHEIAFHGGTSLRLSWNSPRMSEDIDFLVRNDVPNDVFISRKVVGKIREMFFAADPLIQVDVRDKTRNPNRMAVYHLSISSHERIGNVIVKVEFWKVSKEYLDGYPTEFRTPLVEGNNMVSKFLSAPIPAAKLATAYADKLTAFATRPYLKWRDIYDLWWIGTQSGSAIDVDQVAKQFIHNVCAYQTINDLTPTDALRQFLQKDRQKIIDASDHDLRVWLRPELWVKLYPQAVTEMVDYVFDALKKVADHLDSMHDHGETYDETHDENHGDLRRIQMRST